MAMGFRNKPRGLFGYQSQGYQPEVIGHAMPSMGAQPEQKKRWMDGGKFKGKDALALALGAIGDAFSGQPTTANFLLGNMQMRKQQEMAQQQAEQARQAGLEDYRIKKGIDAEYAGPEKGTSLQQNYDWLMSQGREQEAQNLLKRSTDPIQWVTGPDGIPRPFSMGGQAPTAPVGKLTPLGGGGSNATGGFLGGL